MSDARLAETESPRISRFARKDKCERMARLALDALVSVTAAMQSEGVPSDALEQLVQATGRLSDLLGYSAHLWDPK